MNAIIAEEAYQEVRPMIGKVCDDFHRRFGGDRDEQWSVANEMFLRAYQRHDPERAAFTTHVWRQTWYGLMKHQAKETIRAGREKPLEREGLVPDRRSFSLDDFLEGLSEDGRKVAGLALSLPFDLVLALRKGRGGRDREDPVRVREAIVGHLTDSGWSEERIRAAWTEISDALLEAA